MGAKSLCVCKNVPPTGTPSGVMARVLAAMGNRGGKTEAQFSVHREAFLLLSAATGSRRPLSPQGMMHELWGTPVKLATTHDASRG